MTIPEKSIFKVDEVCRLTGIKPYVLRFWETEFESINPITSSSGKKLYERGDLKNIIEIKKLLFEEQMTVEQAKQSLLSGDHLVQKESLNEVQAEKNTPEKAFEPKEEVVEAKVMDIPTLGAVIEEMPTQVHHVESSHGYASNNEAKLLIKELLSDITSIKQRHNWL